MNRTKIEYLDYTWNPFVGCSGKGCALVKVCWAAKSERRKKHVCDLCYSFTPHVHWERMNQPLSVKKPSRIGTVFCGDFYDEEYGEGLRASVKLVMEKANQHFFIVFTKQPQNIDPDEEAPSNLMECVSVNSESDLWRIEALRTNSQAKWKGISFEPLYGPFCPKKLDLTEINWIAIGAQTRPKLLPSPEWVNSLIGIAKQNNIPFWIKNNITWSTWTEDSKRFPSIQCK